MPQEKGPPDGRPFVDCGKGGVLVAAQCRHVLGVEIRDLLVGERAAPDLHVVDHTVEEVVVVLLAAQADQSTD